MAIGAWGGAVRPLFFRLARHRSARIGFAIVAALVLFAAFGPRLAGHDPNLSDFSLERDRFGAPPGPSAAHWLGTDPLFRDLFARLGEGARASLAVATAASLVSTAIGALVGVVAAMSAKTRLALVDALLMRLIDALLALPFLIFVTAVGVAVGRADLGTILLVLGLGGWAGIARIIRARALSILELDFVTAARALGARAVRVAFAHLLPNLWGTLIVLATTGVGQMILAEAVLSYLTVGAPPPRATWGRMLHEAEPYLGTRLMLVAAPGFAIVLSVLGFQRLGDGLRDALDPRAEHFERARGAYARRVPVDLVLAGAALCLLLLGAPNEVKPPHDAKRESAADTPQRGGVLHVATQVNLRSLDPALAYDEASRAIGELVFGRLVTWDARGNIVPDLAREVFAAPDHLSYTFVLRDGLRFHDGTRLTAADVKRGLERLLHPRTPSPGASLYTSIKGYRAFHDGEAPELSGVRVTGEHRLVIELDAPDATLLPKLTLAFAAPVCASAGAFADAQSAALPCGAGPFRVTSFEPDQRVVLARHEGYHQPGKPYLDGIEWLLSVPPSSQGYKFERGELDYTRDLPASIGALYRASAAWDGQHRFSESPSTNAIFLNTEVAPFTSRALRRAVALAIDPSVLEKIRPDVVAATRVVPPSIPGPSSRPPMRRHDLAAALAEMARAGYAFDPKTGAGGYPDPIDYLAVPDTFDQQCAEIWQQQLARVGIRIRLRLVTYAAFLTETSRRRAAAMGKAGWGADFPDASNFFEPTLSTSAIADEHSQNVSFFSNPELDALLDRAHKEPNPARRFADYERAEEIIRDEAPWIPTFGTRTFELWQPALRGYAPHAGVHPRFNDVWLAPRDDARALGATSRLRALGSSPLAIAGRVRR